MQRTRLFLVASLVLTFARPLAIAAESRPISLDEAIKLALAHNLDLQMTRISPEMARLALGGAYSAYDPVFRGGYNHQNSTAPGGIDPQFGPYPGSQTKTDNLDLGITGLTPIGTTYNLFGQFTDSYGSRGGFDVLRIPTGTEPNWVYDPQTGNVIGFFPTTVYTNVPVATMNSYQNAPGRVGISLSQPLLKDFWIDSARYNIAIRKKDLKVSEYQLALQIMRTVTEVQVAYLTLIADLEQVKVAVQSLQETEQQLRENKKRVEVGVLAPLDEKDAESKVAAARAALLLNQNQVVTSQNVLKALLTDQYGTWKDVQLEPTDSLSATPVVLSRQDSWDKALTLRPDVVGVRVEAEKRDIQLKYTYNQLFPQLDVTGSYGLSGQGAEYSGTFGQIADRDNPSWSVGAVVSIPLSNRQARYNHKASKTERELAILQVKKKEQDVMVEVDNALTAVKGSFEQIEARRQASEFAKAAYDAEEKKLANGKSTSFQVLQLQKELTNQRYLEIAALSAYNKSLAQLAFSEGTALERRGIAITTKP